MPGALRRLWAWLVPPLTPEQEAYEAGMAAALEAAQAKNPYVDFALRRAWREGWEAGETWLVNQW